MQKLTGKSEIYARAAFTYIFLALAQAYIFDICLTIFLYIFYTFYVAVCLYYVITYGRPGRSIGSSQLYRKREKDASKTPSLAQASANAPNPHQTHIWTAKVAQTCI